MSDAENLRRFELLAIPHVDAAYKLARWMTRDDHDAQDVTQEALLRALRYMGSFRGDNARAWLLQIVRRTCFSWLKANRPARKTRANEPLEPPPELAAPAEDEPHSVAAQRADFRQINQAIAALPIAYRDVFVLRELEDLSYREIAFVADIPVGTVMSRLARARGLMRDALRPAPVALDLALACASD